MAKHDRRRTSGQPPSSRPVTIQVPLPLLGVVNGVPGSVPWLVHRDRDAGPGGDDGGGSGSPVWPEGAPPGRADRVARRECRQPGDAWRAAGGAAAAPRAERRRRSPAGELPMGGGHRSDGRAHAGCGRRRGVDAPVRGHVGPGTGGRDGAGDVEQRGVAAVRDAVDRAPRGPSVETLLGSKRFEILVAQTERELEALLRQHVPDRGGVMRTDGRCDRLQFASVAAVADV